MSLDVFLEQALNEEAPAVLDLFSETGPKRTPGYNNRLAAEYAAIRSLMEPDKSYSELFDLSRAELEVAPDPKAVFQPYIEKYKAVQTERLTAAAAARIRSGESPEAVLRQLRLTKAFFDEKDQWDMVEVMRGMQAALPYDLYSQMDREADWAPYALLDQKNAELGREGVDPEDFVDWAAVFVGFDATKDNADFARVVRERGIVDAKDFDELGQRYKSMTPVDKQLFWQQTVDALWDTYEGNVPKITQGISSLLALNTDIETSVSGTLDVLGAVDAATLAKAGFKLGKLAFGKVTRKSFEAQRSLKLANRIKEFDPQKAADIAITNTAQNGNLVDAAKNASPYPFEDTVLDSVDVVDGLAPEIVARLEGDIKAVDDVENLMAAAERATLEQRAAELDIWVGEQQAALGGRKRAEVQAELDALEGSLGSARGNARKDAEAKIQRLREQLDRYDSADVGKEYSRKLRKGQVPEEFADDVAQARAAALRSWESAPEDLGAKAARMAREAQEAELAKIKDELGLELKALTRLSKDEVTALKAEAAAVNRSLNAARTAGNGEKVAELEARASALRAKLDEHFAALSKENEIRTLNLDTASPAQKERLLAAASRAAPAKTPAVARLEASKAQPASGASASDAEQAQSPVFSKFTEVDQALREATKGINERMGKLVSGEGFVNVARAAYANKVIDAEKATVSAGGGVLRTADVVEVTDSGFKVRYVLDDGEVTKDYEWTRDAFGNWTTDQLETWWRGVSKAISTKVLSPTAVFRDIDKDVVALFTLGGLQSSKLLNDMLTTARRIMQPLSKEQRTRVESLLTQGDAMGEVYDADALLYTTNIMGRSWDPEEVVAYFQWRAFYDGLHHVQNAAAWRQLRFEGFQELHLTRMVQGKDGSATKEVMEAAVRPANEDELSLVGTNRVSGAGTVEEVGEQILVVGDVGFTQQVLTNTGVKQLIDQGYQLLVTKTRSIGDINTKYILARVGGVAELKPLRKWVLHKPVGYIPRVYKPGLFYVKDKNFNTVAAFDGRKAANAWIAEQAKLREWRVYADQALPPESIELDRINSMGGLWYQSRKTDVLTTPDLEPARARLDLGQATQRYLRGVAEILPLNEYRSGVLEQFTKAVHAVARKNNQEGFVDPLNPMLSEIRTGDPAMDAVFTSTRNYLNAQLGVRSTEESVFEGVMARMVDAMEGSPRLNVLREGARMAQYSDPMARAKGIVFHAYLGMMNFAQLLVQAQNATIAASAYPQYALPAFLDSLKMRLVLWLSKDEVAELSRRAKLDLGSVYSDAAIMKRSGYVDSIYRSGDFHTQFNGLGSQTAHAARSLLRAGAVPFEEGELFSRLISFNIAKRKYMAANPSKKELGDNDIQAIVQDSLRINLNMQKENAAQWQMNSLTGVPTQFLQVQAKFLESVVGGLLFNTGTRTAGHTGMTRAEATRVLVGQLAIYGTLGVPLGEQIFEQLAKANGYVTADGEADVQGFVAEKPDVAEAYAEGAQGLLFHSLGFNVNTSERFSIMAGLDDNVLFDVGSLVMSSPLDDASVQFSDLAPFAGVMNRGKTALDKTIMNFRALAYAPEATPEAMWEAAKSFAAITSTWSNVQKLDLWERLGYTYSRKARAKVEWKDTEMNYQTQLLAGLGFQTDSEYEYAASKRELMDVQDARNKAALFIRLGALEFMKGSAKLQAVYYETAKSYLSGDEHTFRELMVKETEKLWNDESDEAKVKDKTFKELMKGTDMSSNAARILVDG